MLIRADRYGHDGSESLSKLRTRISLDWNALGLEKLIEVHEVTANKLKLDEAFVKVSTGIRTINRTLRCKIDGTSFDIKIEEVKCIELEEDLMPSGWSISESELGYSEMEN